MMREREISLSLILKLEGDLYMRMYFNEDIDISKIKTWKDVQNLRRSSENDFKELNNTFGYDGEKKITI